MLRDSYTEEEVRRIIELVSENVKTGKPSNLLPYICKENKPCWAIIARQIRTVEKYDLTPEKYWHGDREEFDWLLILLSSGYPSTDELLRLGERKTNGDIQRIADCYFQHVAVMFDFVKRHHGYVVLRPSDYMLTLYPHVAGLIYVYTEEKWNHSTHSDINGPFMIINEDELDQVSELIRKKVYKY